MELSQINITVFTDIDIASKYEGEIGIFQIRLRINYKYSRIVLYFKIFQQYFKFKI